MDCDECGDELHKELAEVLRRHDLPNLCDPCLMDGLNNTRYERPQRPRLVKKVAGGT